MPTLVEITKFASLSRRAKVPSAVLCLSLAVGLTSCAHVDVKQIAYGALRQEDCRINQLDDFCTRNFAREYLEYTRMRQDFMRSQTQRTWRVSRDEQFAPDELALRETATRFSVALQ